MHGQIDVAVALGMSHLFYCALIYAIHFNRTTFFMVTKGKQHEIRLWYPIPSVRSTLQPMI